LAQGYGQFGGRARRRRAGEYRAPVGSQGQQVDVVIVQARHQGTSPGVERRRVAGGAFRARGCDGGDPAMLDPDVHEAAAHLGASDHEHGGNLHSKVVPPILGITELLELVASPATAADWSVPFGVPVVLVDLRSAPGRLDAPGTPGRLEIGPAGSVLSGLPTVLVGLGPPAPEVAALGEALDVVVEDPTAILANIERCPLAALSLVLVLRAGVELDVPSALAVESSAYSVLQAGPEFAAWRASRAPRSVAPGSEAAVVVERDGSLLHVTFNRPARHNAFSTEMRDQLFEALVLAASDASVDRVVLDGRGPSFCSGGDLDEFGSLPDPATAHATRLARSAAQLLARLAPKVEARLHGACLGAGIELPAFARRVVARPDSFFGLPELGLGLMPGAGGTVSLPRRIGRQRTAELALSGRRIDAQTSLAWGLIDEIADAES